MLNLGTYRHMTPERYQRYLSLLQAIEELDPARELAIQEIYLLLDPRDRSKEPRHAMVNRLKRDRILVREYSRLPVRYRLRFEQIAPARRNIETILLWDQATDTHPQPALTHAHH